MKGISILKKILFIALALSLFLTQAAHSEVIWNNPGGVINSFLVVKRFYEKTNERVIIAGWCASSCTMFLSLKNACVLPWTQLAFHKSHLSENRDYSQYSRKELRDSLREYDNVLWSQIPSDIQPILGRLTRKVKILYGNQLPEKYICEEYKELVKEQEGK
jgi:hypothetical protein